MKKILIGSGTKIKIQRGEIILVNFDPVRGSEQRGIRPAIVIQNDIHNKHSPTTIIAPITSRIYLKDYPTNVFISKEDSRLSKNSTILFNQIKTIDKSRIIKKISKLNPYLMFQVDLSIKVSLGLE